MGDIVYLQDRFLVSQAQGGSQAAFEELVQAYDQAVLRLALRLTGSASEAQDIYQEAFLKAYRKLDSFRFECSFSTWIYRFAANVSLDHLRRSRARRAKNLVEITADVLEHVSDGRPGNNPERQLLAKELGAKISRALERLTPHERLVFDLRHFQGLTLENVSEILNVSEGSVKATFFRATRKLRLHLGKYTKRRSSSVQSARYQPALPR